MWTNQPLPFTYNRNVYPTHERFLTEPIPLIEPQPKPQPKLKPKPKLLLTETHYQSNAAMLEAALIALLGNYCYMVHMALGLFP